MSPAISVTNVSESKITVNQLFLLAAIIIASVARFIELDGNSIWSDELYSLTFSSPDLSLGYVVRTAVNDVHPPFYMGLLHLYFSAFPFNVSFGRGLSAFFGLLGIIGLYLASRESLPRSTAMAVAAMTAVHNLHFFYSQELRAYALIFFLATMGIWLWHISSRKTSFSLALLAGISFALLSWTHYFGLLFSGLFLSCGALVELYYSRKITKIKIVTFTVFSIGLAFLTPVIIEDLGTSQYWTGKASLSGIAFLFTQLFGGKIAALVSLTLIAWTVIKTSSLSVEDKHYLLVIISFMTIVLAYSVTRYSILIPRFSFSILPLMLILLASFSLKTSKNKTVAWILIAALSYPTFFASVNVYDRRGSGHRLKALVTEVIKARKGEDIVASRPNMIETLFKVYGYPDMKVFPVKEHPTSTPFWLLLIHNVRKPDTFLKNSEFTVLKSIKHKREVAYLLEVR